LNLFIIASEMRWKPHSNTSALASLKTPSAQHREKKAGTLRFSLFCLI